MISAEEIVEFLDRLDFSAIDFRKRHMLPADHLMIVRVPGWVYRELLKGDRIETMLVTKKVMIKNAEEEDY